MRVLVVLERDNAKDEERLKKYREYNQTYGPYRRGVQKGICKESTWTDGTGHVVDIQEFESMEDLAKVWGDDEYHSRFVRFCRLVDNASRRILRPAIPVPLE